MEKIKRTYKGQALHESTLHELIDFTLGISQSEATLENNVLSFTGGDLLGSFTEFIEENEEIIAMNIHVKEKTYATKFEATDLNYTIYKNETIKVADTTSPFIVRRNGKDVPHADFTLSEDGTLTFSKGNIEQDEITVHALTFEHILQVAIHRNEDNQIIGWGIL